MTDRYAATIRPRTEQDIPRAADTLIDVHATDGYPVEGVDRPEAWLTTDKLISAWIAEDHTRVVGHVALSQPDGEEAVSLWLSRSSSRETKIAVLGRLFVSPAMRSAAIGKRLMRTATSYAHKHGLDLVLDVMVKDFAAIRLYESLGWQYLGPATHVYGNGQVASACCYAMPARIS